MNAEVQSIADSMLTASQAMRAATHRIYELESALDRLLRLVDRTMDDSEGHWPSPDAGCSVCTSGTVPNRLNTGLCAYHDARKVMGL